MTPLLLTTTIDCGDCTTLAIKDHEQRKRTYLYVIGEYLRKTDLDLVIVENSGYDLSFISEAFKDYAERIELLSFLGNDGVGQFGKGHGEKVSIRFALANSVKLNKRKFFYKVSGRYYSPDIAQIVDLYDALAESGRVMSINRTVQPNGNIVTVFFGANKEAFLQTFTEDLVIHDLGVLFETAFSRMVMNLPENTIVWLNEMLYENAISSNNEIIRKY
jgi:hypothetical protein